MIVKCKVCNYIFASVYQWLDSLLAMQKAEGSSPFTRSLKEWKKEYYKFIKFMLYVKRE